MNTLQRTANIENQLLKVNSNKRNIKPKKSPDKSGLSQFTLLNSKKYFNRSAIPFRQKQEARASPDHHSEHTAVH